MYLAGCLVTLVDDFLCDLDVGCQWEWAILARRQFFFRNMTHRTRPRTSSASAPSSSDAVLTSTATRRRKSILKTRLVRATRMSHEVPIDARDAMWNSMLRHASLDAVKSAADELERKTTLSSTCLARLLLETSLVRVEQPRDSSISSPRDIHEWNKWCDFVMRTGSCCPVEVADAMKTDADGTYEMTLGMVTHAFRMSITRIGVDYRNFLIGGDPQAFLQAFLHFVHSLPKS